jgi:hypothetical protein
VIVSSGSVFAGMRCDLGYEQLPRRGKGSHEIWRKAGNPRSVGIHRYQA